MKTSSERRKICVVITARPSYSRIKTALDAIQEHPALELQVVVAASALLDRYGNAARVVEKDNFRIDAKVFSVLEGENLTSAAKTTGIGIIEMSTVFDNLRPDVVVTIADRFETMSTAVAASYMNIPLAHVQGGEVTGNIDEKVRHAITKLSDVHFVSTDTARQRLIKMGEDPAKVFMTGCPSIDLAHNVTQNTKLDFDPFLKYRGVGEVFEITKPNIVVMQHPVTTEYDQSRDQIQQTLEAVAELQLPTLWFWPNVDAGADGTSKGIRMFRENRKPTNIHFFKNMEPEDFLKILKNSACIVGNSSVGIRECSFLGIPAVNIGSRQAGRDRGPNVIDTGYNKDEIIAAIKTQVKHGHYAPSGVYGDGSAGKKIAELLASVPLDIEKKLLY